MDDDFDPALELDLPDHVGSLGDFDGLDAPTKKRSNPAGGSLAFELAAALEPAHNQSLFDELGIDDDDDGSSEPAGTDTANTSTALTSEPSTPHRRLVADEQPPEQDFDVAFSEAVVSLEASLSSTDLFLSHLREICDEPSPSTYTLRTSARSAPLSTTARLERLCASLVQALADMARQREAQVRELREFDRSLATLTPAQLAELDPLDEAAPTRVTNVPLGSGLDVVREDDASYADEEPTTPVTPRFATMPTGHGSTSLSVGRASAAQQQLAGLRSSTSSLLATLATINEATQVSRAAHADASRRLKSLRAVLASWRAEDEDVEHAREAIVAYEARRQPDRSLADEAKRETAEVVRRLEAAERRARELLASPTL